MTAPQTSHDLFLSYRRAQSDAVAPFVQALRDAGIGVWQDTREIDALADFSAEIAEALSRAKALLVWYSADYTASIPCQWELTAAFIAAQRAGQPMRRIFVVNPERDAGHIVLPAELANSNHLVPDAAKLQEFVAAIRSKLAGITEPFGAVRPETPPEWWPHKPPAAPRFIGRTLDLWKLQSLLLQGSDTTVTANAPAGRVCIRGLGGMGKTLLTQQYALRFGWAWPGGVFWLEARGGNRVAGDGYSLRSELEPQFSALARGLGIHTDGMEADFVRGMVRQKLGERGGAYLWIIDDVPPGVPLADLAAWSAPTARGKTLVSSRCMQYRLIDGEHEIIGLEAAAGFELLTSRRPPVDEAEKENAREIVKLLGGHPLALEIAAAAIDSSFAAAPYATFLEALQDPADDALAPDPNDLDQLPTGHDRSVPRTVLGSVKLLGDEARQVLLLASRIAEAPIPFDLVVGVLGDSHPVRVLESAVRTLESHALASRDTQTRTVRVHPIVNFVVRRWREAEAAAAALLPRIADTLVDMLGDIEDVRRHPEVDLPLTHAHALASGDPADFLHAPLWLALARHDLAIADYAAAESHVLAIQEDAQSRGKPADRAPLQALNVLADIRHAQGRIDEAMDIARQAFESGMASLGGEDLDTLTAMNNLAGTLKAKGDLDGALELQTSALATSRRVLGDEHPDTLAATNNLALTLHAQGNLYGALELENSVLATRRRVLGDEHPDTLTAMNNLAATLYAKGDLDGALELQMLVLATRRRVLGDEHPYTLTSIGNFANTLKAKGDLDGALELQTSAQATSRRVLGDEHPYTLTAMNNLASTLYAQGNLDAALELQTSALAIHCRVLGDEHPDTLAATNNLALTLQAQGNLDGALELQKTALATSRRVLGNEHPYTLTAMSNLAVTLRAQGDLDGALELETSVLAIRRRVLGDEHPDTVTSMNNLAVTLKARGDLDGAFELETSALTTRRRILGDEHPNTLTAVNNLASTLYAQGNLDGALELETSVLATRRRVLGDEHPDTLTSINNLAGTLHAQGNLDGALELQTSALATRRRVLGDEHPNTLTAMSNLAGMLQAQGNLDGALELQTSTLAIRRRVLGEQHPDTLTSAWNLFTTLAQQEDSTAAKGLFVEYLQPLLKADPATLSADLRAIRQQLETFLSSSDPTPGAAS